MAHDLGTGMPLVALHGYGVDHRILLPLEDMLSGLPVRRIYLDLPWAEGGADRGAASAQDVADEVEEEVRSLLGEQPFALIGNSFGGLMARELAYRAGDRCLGLATLAGVFIERHALRAVPQAQVVLESPETLASAGADLKDYAELTVVQSASTLEAFRTYVLPGIRGSDEAVMARIARAYALPAAPERSGPFAAPSLHIMGRQDQSVGFEDQLAARESYPRGTFAVLDAAGHNVHLEQPEVTRALIRDWVGRVLMQAGTHPA